LEVKTATEPPNADTWRSHFDKANRQIKMSSHDGEIHFDWTAVDLRMSADFLAAADIERLVARKMTDSRGGRIRYIEIRWHDPDTGARKVTYRERRADGNVGPVITEELWQ
jgi:hypothetical protein